MAYGFPGCLGASGRRPGHRAQWLQDSTVRDALRAEVELDLRELLHLPSRAPASAALCWRKPYEECCLVNTQAPITTLPKWSLGIVLLKVRDPTGRDHFLKVVQGS
ncbi:unnamed protein product, partial [Symbiodinium pilosum]